MALATATALALGIGAAASTASGIAGAMANASAQERAALLQDKAVQQWLKVNIPDPEQQKLTLDHFVQVGKLTPQLETAVKQADSNLKDVQLDPGLKSTRLRALGALEQQGYGGQQVQDEAALEKSLIESGAQNRGEQQAIVGSLARRGQLGDGLELQARLDANQAAGDRNASNALDIEMARRNRALQSIEGAGALAGDIQSDQYNADSNLARARDAINQFNTNNLQNVTHRNVDRENDANRYNLDTRQRVADQNVGVNNFQQQYNKELYQKQFDNETKKAAGVGGQYNNQAQQAIDNGKSAAQMWGGIASGVGQAATGVAPRLNRQVKNDKTELPNPTPYTGSGYTYDDEEYA